MGMRGARRKVIPGDHLSLQEWFLCWLSLALLVLVPLVFSGSVYRIYTLPRFAALLVGSSVLVTLLIQLSRSGIPRAWFSSKLVGIVSLYFAMGAVASATGVAPMVSLFGSFENQMGLITHLCFVAVCISLVAGVGESLVRFRRAMWAVSLTGLAVSSYGIAQFLGVDPFVAPDLYTFDNAGAPVLRAASTMGHADYLGNFLLFTAPTSASLALGQRGWARLISVIGCALTTLAIICSGTRGAWLGLVVGVVVFVGLESWSIKASITTIRKWRLRGALTAAAITATVWCLTLTPAFSSVELRARLLLAEGLNSSGRLLLWRDSLKMIPQFALSGSGLEGFRKGFLNYKSEELSRLAPQINNESSHSSYLDSAISLGLPGIALYIAMIVSALSLFLTSRGRCDEPRMRTELSGLTASFIAVLVHKLFIFDQIPTGLYFFAFLALAQIASNVVTGAQTARSLAGKKLHHRKPAGASGLFGSCRNGLYPLAGVIVGLGLIASAVWYSVSLLSADRELRAAFGSARAGSVNHVIAHGRRASKSPEMTDAYNFQFARALTECAEHISGAEAATAQERTRAFQLAELEARESLKHTLTPDSSYVLLAYIALARGDSASLDAYSSEALKWDPNYYITHWLKAEAHLGNGFRDRASIEGHLALGLNPSSREAESVVQRAMMKKNSDKTTVGDLTERCSKLATKGRVEKALAKITRALCSPARVSPECHRSLALVYEAAGTYERAVAEWEIFMSEYPERAAREQIPLRVQRLKSERSFGD
jgi:O-antigen ligase/tetratricopeptide (TPR) repeat protein